MELSKLFGIVGILKESIKILPKNGKLVALLALLYIFQSSIFFWIFSFPIKSLGNSLLLVVLSFGGSSSDPSDYLNVLDSVKEDIGLLLIIYVVFLFVFTIISCFFTTSIILVSALSYQHKSLPIKDLIVMVAKSWTRPLVTSFYTTLLVLGYVIFVSFIVYPLFMIHETPLFYVAILISIIAYIFYLYLAVVWILAIVVSVMEQDCIGVEALGKAAMLVKGERLHGFLLNLVYNLISLIISLGLKYIVGNQWLVDPKIMFFFTQGLSILFQILMYAAYTVFYFRCKKNHGEEIELQGGFVSLEYSKISTTLYNDVLAKV